LSGIQTGAFIPTKSTHEKLKIMDNDYQLTNIVLMVPAVVMIFLSLVLIYFQKFAPKINIGVLLIPICYLILLLIFYRSQFKPFKRSNRSFIHQKVDLIILSVSGLFAILVLILIGGLMIYCQRIQNETNIAAENQMGVSKLLQNSKDIVELTQRDHIKVDYPIAMSNRLFKSSELLKDVPWPCQNCHLISMGSMACYQEKCPECDRTPPNRSPV